ncbi:MAG: 2,3-diphosphoglycerate-dependent phosphoglycerate mutase [Actinobacteria bacterium]|nr:2,3-diphosphoglycerate-dependent phosphoglycerate mutase [Actinomycetota bacterium]
MFILTLLRHGESIWNKENRFTGWTDVDLSAKGVNEAKEAGFELKKEGYFFDLAFTSVLKRSIRFLWIVLDYMDLMWIDERKSWRLNERFYGALQGLNKIETSKKYGEEQVHIWRRSYDISPPAINKNDLRFPGNDPKYSELKASELPLTESLKDTLSRILPYWHKEIVPEIKLGRKILIVAHGNSLRSLIKHIDSIPDEEIADLNIPLGIPLIYEFNKNMEPANHYYLGDKNRIKKSIDGVSKEHISL